MASGGELHSFGRKPIGNGPFQADTEWVPGRGITLSRYDNYAGQDKAKSRGVILRVYTELSTAYTDVLAGNLDILKNLPPDAYASAKDIFGDRYLEHPSPDITSLGFPLYDPRYADVRGIRQGDWIVSWDGRAIESASHFMQLAAAARPGLPIQVRILRNGQSLMETFTPGRRPFRDGQTWRHRLPVVADGRVLVPGRRDFAWVDLAAGTRTSFWTYEGTGVVESVEIAFGLAIARVGRLREGDVLCAVDPSTGLERWRTVVDGAIDRVEATGSALVVYTEGALAAPMVHVLDAATGSLRMRLETPDILLPSSRTVPAHRSGPT